MNKIQEMGCLFLISQARSVRALRWLLAMAVLTVTGNFNMNVMFGPGLVFGQAPESRPSVGFGIDERLYKLLKDGRFAEAEVYAQKSSKVEPGLFAWLKLKQGKIAEGLEMLKTELASHRDVAQALRVLTIIEDASTEEALSFCQQLIADDLLGDHPLLKLRLVELLLKTNAPDEAMKAADAVLATGYSDDALKQPLFKLSAYLYKKHRAKEAIRYSEELFDKVPETRLDPGYLMQTIHYNTEAGNALESLKRLDSLEKNYPAYFRENPGLFLLAKAQAFDKLGDWQEAERQLKDIKLRAKNDPKLRGMLAMVDAKLDEYSHQHAAIERATAAAEKATPYEPIKLPETSRWRKVFVLMNVLGLAAILIFWSWRRRQRATGTQASELGTEVER